MTEGKSNTEQPITKTDGNLSYLQKRHRYIQPYQNLVIQAISNSQVDIDADYITVEGYKFDSINLTVDISVSGVGGLDTGSESNDAHYYIWIIGNLSDTAVGGLLSLQYPGSGIDPTLPTGYTIKECVGAVRNTGGNFVGFNQRDKLVVIGPVDIGSTASASYVSRSLSSFVPKLAIEVKGDTRATYSTSGVRGVKVASTSTGFGEVTSRESPTGGGIIPMAYAKVSLIESQTMYIRAFGTVDSVTMYISGWRLQ